MPAAGELMTQAGWYGQFSQDGADWIFYIQDEGKWYPFVNGEQLGSGYEKILYHSFNQGEDGSNALSILAEDETGVVLWSDGSETKRNNVIDMFDNGEVQVLIYEYKGKQLVDVNGERLGIFDEIDTWYVQ